MLVAQSNATSCAMVAHWAESSCALGSNHDNIYSNNNNTNIIIIIANDASSVMYIVCERAMGSFSGKIIVLGYVVR